MLRRDFLIRTGMLVSASLLASDLPLAKVPAGEPGQTSETSKPFRSWNAIRQQFALARDRIHMSCFFLASHPTPVRQAIEQHRRALDDNPIGYWMDRNEVLEADVLRAASDYLGVQPIDIALTDSTTMGLGLLYGGLALADGEEVLTTVHDHYSTEMSLKLRAERTGATVRQIPLYRDLAVASKAEIVDTLLKAIQPNTRYVAVTWVHSSTGLKLPIREIADALATINAARSDAQQILLCVDGVHGLGVEDVTLKELGCDFFVAGTHKWMFGPRGTGLVWGHSKAWRKAHSMIPTFSHDAYRIWTKEISPKPVPFGAVMTPGGFHSFEHRWAVAEAFRFHLAIGKRRVTDRIHTLNTQLKDGLAHMPHIRLITPQSRDLSAGIVCFEIEGWRPEPAVDHLRTRGIMGSVTPYATPYVRLAPSLVTLEPDIERTLRELRAMKR
jgi:selenocysteine lyase/cysteine desulfurase